MHAYELVDVIERLGIDFFTGVPDSTIAEFTDVLVKKHKDDGRHIAAHNEGGCVALACGHYLSTGKPAVVYMQNSGIGNAVNPVTSLAAEEVYDIPIIYIIGWRGEPGTHDEPQHIFQGKITVELMETLGVHVYTIDQNTTVDFCGELVSQAMRSKKSIALLIKNGTFDPDMKKKTEEQTGMSREEAAEIILSAFDDNSIFISTTGKLSREIFEIREHSGRSHEKDFLTVGSMGHASMIALKTALNNPTRRVLCLDGDGAVIMHMGSLAVIGEMKPQNLIHVVINNFMYESVGNIATASASIDLQKLAEACGYTCSFMAENVDELKTQLIKAARVDGPVFLEVRTNAYSRKSLGRPTTTPAENKLAFMKYCGVITLEKSVDTLSDEVTTPDRREK